MKSYKILGAATLFAATALGPAFAQTTQPTPEASQTNSSASQPSTTVGTTDNGSYATGKPLEMQSKEGFWGHVNPFARKKWVHRQIDPIRDRANELDELQSKNANEIRDVDSRATAGINKAMSAASAADAHAADAANRAGQANTLANTADTRATTLNGTVQNLDQYSEVSSESIPFYKGRTMLTKSQKDKLSTMGATLASEKGYVVEVQGYSRSGVAHSQAMADSVVRYLVTDQNVPVYRIYRTGMGRAKATATDSTAKTSADNNEKPLTNGVRVTVLHNSLATMGQPATASPANTTSQTSPTGAYTTGTPTSSATTMGTSTPQ